MKRKYTVRGSYYETEGGPEIPFEDSLKAECAQAAFEAWQAKHEAKLSLRFIGIDPID